MLASLIVTIDTTIVLIGLPAIFRGVNVNPLAPGNTKYMLWMILGFTIVTAVLVVSLGRLGDIYGRVRIYSYGYVVFTFFSILLSITWLQGRPGRSGSIAMRIGQGLGGAMLFGNAGAIVTDAFPVNQRGMALGLQNIAAVAGSTLGLVLGGVLAPISWRLIFLVSVPVGLFGTVWAFLNLRELGERRAGADRLVGQPHVRRRPRRLMIGITGGIQPYGHHAMSWSARACSARSAAASSCWRLRGDRVARRRAAVPAQPVPPSRVHGRQPREPDDVPRPRRPPVHPRDLAAGHLAARARLRLLEHAAVGGHPHAAADRRPAARGAAVGRALGPLRRAPVRDARRPARPRSRSSCSRGCRSTSPTRCSRCCSCSTASAWACSSSPNRAAIMNSLPPWRRGVGSGMASTFTFSAQVLSIGIFFSLMIVGLSGAASVDALPRPIAHGVPRAVASHIAHLPPVSSLFATFLGYNPVQHLLGHHLAALPHAQVRILTGHSFFPRLITKPFASALNAAFTVRADRLPARGGGVAAARRALPLGRERAGGRRRRRRGRAAGVPALEG